MIRRLKNLLLRRPGMLPRPDSMTGRPDGGVPELGRDGVRREQVKTAQTGRRTRKFWNATFSLIYADSGI